VAAIDLKATDFLSVSAINSQGPFFVDLHNVILHLKILGVKIGGPLRNLELAL
jgi:hypothetical protein